jgi:hypothetical protein
VSDSSQGPGWWQASDGKWYPPEQAPGYQQPAPGGPYGAPYGGGGGGGSATGGTDVGSVLSYSWNKFVQSIGEWVILWLIAVVASIVVSIVIGLIAFGGGMAGGFSGIRFSGLGIVLGILGGMVTGVVFVVLAKAAVQAVNGQSIDIGAAFQLTGNNIAAGLVFGAVYGLANSICSLFTIPVFMLLGFLPVLSALDDKGADAIGESVSLSTSRASESIVFWLIGWFISSCLCFIGAPLTVIGGVYLAKRFRGDSVAP